MAKSPSLNNDEGFDNPEDIFASLDDLLDGKLAKKNLKASAEKSADEDDDRDLSMALDNILGTQESIDDSLTIQDEKNRATSRSGQGGFSAEDLSLADLLETSKPVENLDTQGFDPQDLSLADLLGDDEPQKSSVSEETIAEEDEDFSIDDLLTQAAPVQAREKSVEKDQETLGFSAEDLSLEDLIDEDDDEDIVVGGEENTLGFDPKELSLRDLLDDDEPETLTDDLSLADLLDDDEPEALTDDLSLADLLDDDEPEEVKAEEVSAPEEDEEFSIDDILEQANAAPPKDAPKPAPVEQNEAEFSIDDLIDQVASKSAAKGVEFSPEELALDDLIDEEEESEADPVVANSKDLKKASTVAAEVTPSDTQGLKQAKPVKPAAVKDDVLDRLDDVMGDLDPDSILEQVSQAKTPSPKASSLPPSAQNELELLDNIFDGQPTPPTPPPPAATPTGRKPLPPLKSAAPPPPKEVENELESLDGWGLSAKPAKPEPPKKVPPVKAPPKPAEESAPAEEPQAPQAFEKIPPQKGEKPASDIEKSIRSLNQPLGVDKKEPPPPEKEKEEDKIPVLKNILIHGNSRGKGDVIGGSAAKKPAASSEDQQLNELVERLTNEIHLKLSSQLEQHFKNSMGKVMQQAMSQVSAEIEPIIRQQIQEVLPQTSRSRQGR